MNASVHQGDSRRSVVAMCRDIEFRGQGRALLRDDLTPPAFFDRLVEARQYNDAIRFLAHALPRRVAIWWGCLCLWRRSQPELDVLTAAALRAACRWVLEPSDAHRRAAEAPGRAAGLDSAAGCLAMAVFWCGGSMGRADLPPLPPPPALCPRVLAGAILLAAAQSGTSAVRTQTRREFLGIGREVAAGALWWEPVTPPDSVAVDPPEPLAEPLAALVTP
jgi:hypothetical protein